jgi:integrase
MSRCSYLVRRSARYYFQARLPTEIARFTGRAEVVISLRTADLRAAKIICARIIFSLASIYEQISDMIATGYNLNSDGLRRAERLAQEAFALGAECEVKVQEVSREVRRAFDERLQLLTASIYDERSTDDKIVYLTPRAHAEADASSDLQPTQPTVLPQNAHTFVETRINAATLENLAPKLPLLQKNLPKQQKTLPLHKSEGPTSLFEERCRDDFPAWARIRAEFFADRPGLGAKTLLSYNQAIDFFAALIDGKPIAAVCRQDVKKFADFLRDRESGRKGQLSHASISKSLSHIKSLLSWAVSVKLVDDDGFEKIVARDKTRAEIMAGDHRRAFKRHELEKLFKSPLFQEFGSVRDIDKRWFIVVSLLTGGRTGEIAEAPAALAMVGDVPCISLLESGTKTRAAPRLVPIPLALQALGFLEFARKRAESGRYLFPSRAQSASGGWSKWGNRFIDLYVAEDPLLTLYSLRHCYRQMQRAADLGDELRNKVFGHSTDKAGEGYGSDLSEAEARKYVRELRPPLNLSELRDLLCQEWAIRTITRTGSNSLQL